MARETLVTAAVLALFVLAAGVMLFPLSLQLSDLVPDWGDPLENTWVLAWDAHQLLQDPLSLYAANIFYPYSNSLAFSESQVASALFGMPVYLSSGNPILGYNFVFILSFILSGFNTYLLAYDLTRSRWGAILAGFAFAFWPYKLNHLSHINLVTLQWLPLVFFALRRAFVYDSWRMRRLLAVSLIAQVLSSWYAALMTGMGVALYATYLILRVRPVSWKRVLALALTLAVSLAIILPVALPYFQVSRELGFVRSLRETERLSAVPLSFLSVSPFNRLYHNLLSEPWPDALFPGSLVLLLAFIGALTKRLTANRAFWLILIGTFGLLSFGPTLHLSADLPAVSMPYRLLYDFIPGIQGTRAPARFFVVGMLGLGVLAAAGFARLAGRSGYRIHLLGALGLVILGLEYEALPVSLARIETGSEIPAVYHWLAEQPPGSVLELPTQVGQVDPITRAMYMSTFHWHPTLLGYGSFMPQTQVDLLSLINSSLNPPTPRVLNLLREMSVKYVILHRKDYEANEWDSLIAGLGSVEGLELAFADDHDPVYRVTGTAPPHPLGFSYLLPARASPGGSYLPYLVIQHSRKYPVATRDPAIHTLTVVWKRNGVPIFKEVTQLKLPELLRSRPEGVALNLTAPGEAGLYETDWSLDSQPLRPIDQNVHVLVQPLETRNAPDLSIQLVSYILDQPELMPGGEGVLTLFWRRVGEVREEYDVVVTLYDASGNPLTTIRQQPVLWTYPTRLWRDGELVADAYSIAVPQTARGPFRLRIELKPQAGDVAVSFRDPLNRATKQFDIGPFCTTR